MKDLSEKHDKKKKDVFYDYKNPNKKFSKRMRLLYP